MTDFIEGAAYVSPSRNQVYTIDLDGTPRDCDGVAVYAEDLPDDLVMIWAPGYAVKVQDRLIMISPPMEELISVFESQTRTSDSPPDPEQIHDRVFQGIQPGIIRQISEQKKIWSALNQLSYQIRGAAWPKPVPRDRDWFYPTRYNEQPGSYEDERGGSWKFSKENLTQYGEIEKHWARTDRYGGLYEVPADLQGIPIAVRWVGELDD